MLMKNRLLEVVRPRNKEFNLVNLIQSAKKKTAGNWCWCAGEQDGDTQYLFRENHLVSLALKFISNMQVGGFAVDYFKRIPESTQA